jgi:membrane protein
MIPQLQHFFKKQFYQVFVNAFHQLKRNDPLRLAGATAFFTTFALPPMLIVLIQLFGLIMDEREIGKEMFHALSKTVGIEGANEILTIFRGMKALAINWYIAIGGFVFLLFVSTTLFKVIKDSVNQLWRIRPAEDRSIGLQLRMRFKSFLVIVLAGILFFAGVLADGLQSILGHYLQDISVRAAALLILFLNKLISLSIVTIWFTLLFRFLPDAKPVWRVAIAGGLLTGILFTIGKILLRMLLPYKNINSVFGASGSFVLLLLFVFYSSFILYYGACFTVEYANYCGKKIKPRVYASAYQLTETTVE